ncbi:MAG: hypothetical protein AB7G25_12420 [Sphingomonadaceae bacterium]
MRALMGRLTLIMAAGVAVSACGGESTDTVDSSELTELNAAGMMEGTINDAAAMDVATDANIAATNITDTVSDNEAASNSAE